MVFQLPSSSPQLPAGARGIFLFGVVKRLTWVFLNFYKIYGGGAFLELSYYKVCCAVMKQCSYVAGDGMTYLWWWGYGGGQEPPKTGQNRVKVTRKGMEKGQR